MNTRDNLIFILCFFPGFIFKSNFNFQIIIIILFFFFLISYLNYFFLRSINFNNKYKLRVLYLSLVFTYGLDNHLGLYNGLIMSNFQFVITYFRYTYFAAFFLILIFFLLIMFFLNYTDPRKNSVILIFTVSSLLIFNLIDNTKSHKNIPYFKSEVKNLYENRNLILILDEMSGLNSISSDTNEGREFNKKVIELFEKYNFEYYTDVYSNSKNSVSSLASLLNFTGKVDKKTRDKIAISSKNYFVEYEFLENKVFDKFDSVSVFQNIHINYCKNKNVKKCYQYDPFDLNKINAEVDKFSEILSIWSINGSIFARVILRIFKQFGLAKSILEPEGEKIFFNNILNVALEDINNKKHDLIFIHLLVPHKPYGYNKNCDYDVKLSNLNNLITLEEHFKRHNNERMCLIYFLDNFFSKILDINKLKIYLISDHGSRITSSERSSYSSIFAYKGFYSNFVKKMDNKVISQEIFKTKFDE